MLKNLSIRGSHRDGNPREFYIQYLNYGLTWYFYILQLCSLMGNSLKKTYS